MGDCYHPIMQNALLPRLIGVVTLLSLCLFAAADEASVVREGPLAELVYGRETTYFTDPRREDGSIKYVAAVNARLGEGVEPGENGLVDLVNLLPPEDFGEDWMRERMYEALGVEPPRGEGAEYFLQYEEYLESRSLDATDALEVWNATGDRVWRAEEFPHVAEYLDAMGDRLEVITAATRKSAFFMPLTARDSGAVMFEAVLPPLGAFRYFANTLRRRALLRAGSGDVDGAWADVMTIYRLARMQNSEGFLIERLVGISIAALATGTVERVASAAPLSREAAAKMIREYQALPPLPSLESSLGGVERWGLLDGVMQVRAGHAVELFAILKGISDIDDWAGQDARGYWFARLLGSLALHPYFDTNLSLRHVQSEMDRLIAASEEERLDERYRRLAEWEARREDIDLYKQIHRMAEAGTLPEGERTPAYTTAATDLILSIFMPGYEAAFLTADRVAAYQRFTPVALAVAAYRTEHGRYPAALADLVPHYLEAVPLDPFTGDAIRYRVVEGAAVIYSVGFDRVDDGGGDLDSGVGGADVTMVVAKPSPR